MDDWDKAGEIAGEGLVYGKNLVKKGVSLLEVTQKIEQKLIQLGGKPGFPIQISINDIAAHYTSTLDDPSTFNADLVKLDLGASYNGAIGDNAVTIDLSGKYRDLCKASYTALVEAIKTAKPGVSICTLGEVVEETIKGYGFKPITNLSGHGISRYIVHDSPSIPNYNNGDKTKLKEGQIIAIEPFATDGVGMVIEGGKSFNFRLLNVKPVRNAYAKKIMDYLHAEFKTMPFSQRWLYSKFTKLEISVGMNLLLKEGVLQNYAVLPEKGRGMVAQFEHTLRVGDRVLTKVEGSH